MSVFINLADDDRVWLRIIKAADLYDLFTDPHGFVQEAAEAELADAFSLQYSELGSGQSAFFGPEQLMPGEYALTGIDKTGVLFLEGNADDSDLDSATLPTPSKGFEAAIAEFNGGHFGGVHFDVGGASNGAALLVMAIRHRSTLASLLSQQAWNLRHEDGRGRVVARHSKQRLALSFAARPTVGLHATKLTLPQSCFGSPVKPKPGTVLANIDPNLPLDATLGGVIIKAN